MGRAGSYADVAERNAASQEPDGTARKGEPETKDRPPAAENPAATAPNRKVSRVALADGGPVVMETPDRSAVPVEKPDPVQHRRAANPSTRNPLPGAAPAAAEQPVPQPDGASDGSARPAESNHAVPERTGRADGKRHAQRRGGRAGDLILYPSGSLHHVTPVTRGTRLCALLWIQSMVRDTQRRTLLFDLDRSVQALTRERGTTDAEVHRLTGVYHTLVRLWADV